MVGRSRVDKSAKQVLRTLSQVLSNPTAVSMIRSEVKKCKVDARLKSIIAEITEIIQTKATQLVCHSMSWNSTKLLKIDFVNSLLS
jgi:predicted metallopeptidase